jgi:hypothetical protein
MRNFNKPYWYCIFFFFIIIITGCGSALKNMSGKLTEGVSNKADTLTYNLAKGVTDELTNPVTRKRITNLIDSIVTSLDSVLELKIPKLEGKVINHKIILWSDSLVEAFTGKKLKLNVKALQYELMGRTTKDILTIRNSFKELLDDILSEDTDKKLGKLRDELLGAKTDTAISRIVDHATTKVTNQILKVNQAAKGDISDIGRYGGLLLLLTGVIAAIIIFIVWWNKRRYLQMTTLLAKHIHNIPDQNIYDKVTAKIKDEAITTGLEPHLRKILTANGLIGNSNWNKKEMD